MTTATQTQTPDSDATTASASSAPIQPSQALPTLRLCTAGSVDDGKSTFVGRLLHDTQSIMTDQYEAVERTSTSRGLEQADLSLLVDGLRAEREQGITIDVAYRYFATPNRSFILADCPGHEQYTRNTVTGMSTAEAVVLLVDIRNGVIRQTNRHATVAGLLGVRHVIVAVNKIDLVDYDENRFREVEAQVHELAAHAGLRDVHVVPISSLVGDNVVDGSENTPWYTGPSVIELLEGFDTSVSDVSEAADSAGSGSTVAESEAASDSDASDRSGSAAQDSHAPGFRLPIQYVIRDHATEYRGYAGRITSGSIAIGDTVALPQERQTTVKSLTIAGEPADRAVAGDSVSLELAENIDLARGDLITAVDRPAETRALTATVVHLHDQPLAVGRQVKLRYGAAVVRARVASIEGIIDVDTGRHVEADDAARELHTNDVAEVRIELAQALPVEPFVATAPTLSGATTTAAVDAAGEEQEPAATAPSGQIGSFLIIHPQTGDTLTAGLVTGVN